ncbi:DEAD/DEAH box helicase [Gulosibacter molinativorax]|uniref:RNA helicase n=1 Tax=Gulosibacter molinativorax TaxID=256821 RepID=A0ABT7C641_9MICO|nr:DEAD/DEAH box helicase [Gulosibacter molinativorax]MDJ1370141.1 RNA helicase [Gulosibacter molinativorax]QUY61552.1 Helicase helY [Gulosibacter molinativorax]
MAEPSAAERFARAKNRAKYPEFELFRSLQRFDLDEFQAHACQSLESGSSVLVAAPTGAGKTIVAEFAVFLAMRDANAKIFYTAPIKALSNQKYREFAADYGASEVGLLTGDVNINSQARIVVMTTEVLRNMIYAGSDLMHDLAYVVMDEVHYLADRFRGAVWEEIIIHLPSEVRLVSLSATVSNAEEFGDWLQAVRGDTDVIVSEIRPTPLYQHVLVGSQLHDLFRTKREQLTDQVNPELVRAVQQFRGTGGHGRSRRGGRGGTVRHAPRLDRGPFVEMLDEYDLLPAIFFIFSRAGCDAAVQQVVRYGVRLTTHIEADEIRWIVEERTRNILDEDLAALGFWEWKDALERGVAAHHAGLLPAFKEIVEELFQRKLVKVVFATETLALGINMPARTVVLENLEKFNGVSRVPITPGEYTQLTGRAGRRGIDVEGHAIVQWREGVQPENVASLASKRSYPLNSSFRPTYNMTVNLVDRFGREQTRALLESSFAQFQADRAVVEIARRVKQQREALDGYAESMHCDRGDFYEYSEIRRNLSDLEKQRILKDDPRFHELRETRSSQLQELREQLKRHGCHSCPKREDHARWAERYWKLQRDTDKLAGEISRRTGAVARTFDRLTDLLLELGYLRHGETEDEVHTTAHGQRLKQIFGERDLLVAECIRRQVWLNLEPAALAAMACALTYEPRRDEENPPIGHLPKGGFRESLEQTEEIWAKLDELEHTHRVPRTNPLATGLVPAMFRWASGAPLDRVLEKADLAAGDFVRWCKQTLDLLDQISLVESGKLATAARQAGDLIRRGIVAYSGAES